MSRGSLLAALLLGAAALPACSFHRGTVNGHLRSLDPSRIVVGRSTWRDVLRELGTPAAATHERLTREVPTLEYFRYVAVVGNTVGFTPSYWVSLPCEWRDTQRVYELLVEFDGAGVVSDLCVRTEDSIWRPLEGDADRVPPETRFPAAAPGGTR